MNQSQSPKEALKALPELPEPEEAYVEAYIRALQWSPHATDHEKSVVAGNLRTFARRFHGTERAIRAALAYIDEPAGLTPEIIADKVVFKAHMARVEERKTLAVELLRTALAARSTRIVNTCFDLGCNGCEACTDYDEGDDMPKGELPELPEPRIKDALVFDYADKTYECAGYTPSQMRAYALAAIDQLGVPAEGSRPAITLTGLQLKRALYWAVPDGDPDHLEAEVSIGWSDGVESEDEELAISPGYVLWWSDYPEEGCVPLDEQPPGTSAAPKEPTP